MTTPFGAPFQSQPPRSIVSTLIVEPTLGFDVSHSALNIPGGATPNSDNFIMRDGRLEPRSGLSFIGLNVQSFAAAGRIYQPDVCGGIGATSVEGAYYLLVGDRLQSNNVPSDAVDSPTEVHLWYRGSGDTVWTRSSITTAFGLRDTLPDSTTNYWDFTQMYSDEANENIVVGAITSRESGLYCWKVGEAVYSVLTGSPGARCVTAFDNYLLAGNTVEGGANYTQRVRWCDRGSASSWTGGLSGFEDLLAARGGVNRILPLESRVVVFFDDEIWTGTPTEFPSVFRFDALDTTIGCPYPRTAAVTPRGIMFMARNFQLYLLSKDGGVATPIGAPVHRSVRESIVQAPRAFGCYDGVNNGYQFYYSSAGSGNLPHRALFLNLDTGAWAPQSYISNIGLLGAFTASIGQSNASTWDDMTATWDNVTESWNDMLGIGNERQVVVVYGTNRGVYVYDSKITRDHFSSISTQVQTSSVFSSFWESDRLGEEWPGQQKTITKVDVDYVAPSNSSLTVRTLQGGTFAAGSLITLPASSAISQAPAYLNTPSRYAAIRVENSNQTNYQLQRFHVTMRVGGR